MSITTPPLLLETLATVAVLFTSLIYLWRKKTAKYPPGPPARLFVGNISEMPKTMRWERINDAAKKYGDVFMYYNHNTRVLCLNSYEAVHELLVNRVQIYSDRPGNHMTELIGDIGFPFMNFGPSFVQQRKLFGQNMNQTAVKQFVDVIDEEATTYVQKVWAEPHIFVPHMRLMASKLILRVTYGLRIDSLESPYVKIPEECVQNIISGLRPHYWAVDKFPIMKYLPTWLPGMDSVRKARHWGSLNQEMQKRPFEWMKARINENKTVEPSIASKLLEEQTDVDEKILRIVTSTMYTGGADTTTTTIHSFYLAMLHYPETMRKAQEEIDRVIGKDRLPTIADQNDLPYVGALVKEISRGWIIVPLAGTHRLRENDVYRDWVLPKGTLVVPNSWAISQDPKLFHQPEKFIPERWLKPDDAGDDWKAPLDITSFAFGYGRRICPGINFASLSVWSTMTHLLATTTIKPMQDKNGNDILPSLAAVDTGNRSPVDFECRIAPRSEAARRLVDDEVASYD